MEARNGLEPAGLDANQQLKRKTPPTGDEKPDEPKRLKPSGHPESSNGRPPGSMPGGPTHALGERNGIRDRERHRSKGQSSKPSSPARAPSGRMTSPLVRAGSKSRQHSPNSSLEPEAGEIGRSPPRQEHKNEERSRSRPHSRSHSHHRQNGSAKEPHGPASRPGVSPRPGMPGSMRDKAAKQSPTPSSFQSSMLAEVRLAALNVQKKREEDEKRAQTEQEQQLDDVGLGRARGKHSPIVWNKSSASPETLKRPRELSAQERAESELESFKKMRAGEVDADAPPAIKPSPSNSDKEEDLATRRSGSIANDVVSAPPRSRWLDVEDDGQEAGDAEADLKALNRHEQQDLELERQLEQESEESDGDDLSDFQRLRPPIDMLKSSRSVEHYKRLNRVSEGTYGVVHRAEDKESHVVCALKQIKMAEEKDGFPLSSIREINILLSLRHKNIVDVSEVVVGKRMDDIFMVMEYMEHDLKHLMNQMEKPFTITEVKNLMYQLLEGVAYLHSNWVLHRDLKTSNILYNNRGQLKICDFGMARQFGSPLRPYTHNVVTLLYRSIELLLGQRQYSTAVDMWSLGCIMAELITKDILFMGGSELDQIDAIFRIMGTPTEKDWPGFSQLPNVKTLRLQKYPRTLREHVPMASRYDPASGLSELGFDLLERLLCPNPAARISAEDALQHPWFQELPRAKKECMMPTFAESKTRGNTHQRALAGRNEPPARNHALGSVFA